jgi:hypothetical protein
MYRDAISLRHRPVTLHYVPSDARAVLELSMSSTSVAPLWEWRGWAVEPQLGGKLETSDDASVDKALGIV